MKKKRMNKETGMFTWRECNGAPPTSRRFYGWSCISLPAFTAILKAGITPTRAGPGPFWEFGSWDRWL